MKFVPSYAFTVNGKSKELVRFPFRFHFQRNESENFFIKSEKPKSIRNDKGKKKCLAYFVGLNLGLANMILPLNSVIS